MADVQYKEGPTPPNTHNAPAAYEEFIREQSKFRRPGGRENYAPKDKLDDLRQEPRWLLPEFRSWAAISEEDRKARIEQTISRLDLKDDEKRRQLRCILQFEESKSLAMKCAKFIWP